MLLYICGVKKNKCCAEAGLIMRKSRKVLGALLMLCTLLNCTGCVYLRAKYNVFSDKEHTITQVSSTDRDYIGIVLDEEELVVCDYKGHELSRKRFEKTVTSIDTFFNKVLVQFDDDSIELYYLDNSDLILKLGKSFSSAIAKAELIEQWEASAVSMVVLLENGELYSSKDYTSPEDLDLISEHVKTVVTRGENFFFITEDGEVVHYRYGSPYEPAPEIEPEIASGIKELKIASFNGKEGFLGIGNNQFWYLRGIPLRLDTDADISYIDPEFVIAGHSYYYSVLYLDNGKWYYEGIARDYESSIRHENRRRIRPSEGESMLPIPGGVIFYTDHDVRIQLI